MQFYNIIVLNIVLNLKLKIEVKLCIFKDLEEIFLNLEKVWKKHVATLNVIYCIGNNICIFFSFIFLTPILLATKRFLEG